MDMSVTRYNAVYAVARGMSGGDVPGMRPMGFSSASLLVKARSRGLLGDCPAPLPPSADPNAPWPRQATVSLAGPQVKTPLLADPGMSWSPRRPSRQREDGGGADWPQPDDWHATTYNEPGADWQAKNYAEADSELYNPMNNEFGPPVALRPPLLSTPAAECRPASFAPVPLLDLPTVGPYGVGLSQPVTWWDSDDRAAPHGYRDNDMTNDFDDPHFDRHGNRRSSLEPRRQEFAGDGDVAVDRHGNPRESAMRRRTERQAPDRQAPEHQPSERSPPVDRHGNPIHRLKTGRTAHGSADSSSASHHSSSNSSGKAGSRQHRAKESGTDRADFCTICELRSHGSLALHNDSSEHRRKSRLASQGCSACAASSFKSYALFVAHAKSEKHLLVVKLVNHRKEKADSPDLVIVDTVGICDDKAAASSVICVDDVSRQKRRATHSLDSNQTSDGDSSAADSATLKATRRKRAHIRPRLLTAASPNHSRDDRQQVANGTHCDTLSEVVLAEGEKETQDEEEEQAEQEGEESDMLQDSSDMLQATDDIVYNANVATGQEYIVPAAGFFCRLCRKFYMSEEMAKGAHCRTEQHFERYRMFLSMQLTGELCGEVPVTPLPSESPSLTTNHDPL